MAGVGVCSVDGGGGDTAATATPAGAGAGGGAGVAISNALVITGVSVGSVKYSDFLVSCSVAAGACSEDVDKRMVNTFARDSLK